MIQAAETGDGQLRRSGLLSIAMRWQLDRLRAALAAPDPWHGLVMEFPAILDVVLLAPSEVTRLYRAYVEEWDGVGPDLTLPRQGGAAAL